MARVYVTRKLPGTGLDRLAAEHEVTVWPERLPPRRPELWARAAECEPEVGNDGMWLDACDGSRRHVLLLAERSADREERLPVHDGRLRRLRAPQRHGPH